MDTSARSENHENEGFGGFPQNGSQKLLDQNEAK